MSYIPVALYGVMLIGYHDGGGDAFVKMNGGEVDADLAGGIALSVAVFATIVAAVLLRSGSSSARSRSLTRTS